MKNKEKYSFTKEELNTIINWGRAIGIREIAKVNKQRYTEGLSKGCDSMMLIDLLKYSDKLYDYFQKEFSLKNIKLSKIKEWKRLMDEDKNV